MRLLPRILLSLVLSAPMAWADVLIVDPTGTQGFSQIQAAIDAAQDGDLILVRSGTYAGFALVQRSLTVRADVNAEVEVDGGVAVLGTPASGVVLIAGLSIEGAPAPWGVPGQSGEDALALEDNPGFVRVEGCELRGGFGAFVSGWVSTPGGDGCSIAASLKTALVGCTLIGGFGGGDPFASSLGGLGGHGLRTQGSPVGLYDCAVLGGSGGVADYYDESQTGGPGGPGAEIVGFGIYASNTTFTGGSGGYGYNGGPGGDGLVVQAGAQAQLLSSPLVAGAGGNGEGGSDGEPGQASSGGGLFFPLPGSARVFAAPSLARDGSIVGVTVTGQPGDAVWIVPGQAPAHVPAGSFAGLWLAARPVLLTKAPLAVLGPSGSATVSLPVPALDPATPSRQLFLQGFVVALDGTMTLGSPAHPTIVDCASVAPDCNGSGAFDTCDLLAGASIDCNDNSIPDECEADCNGNGIADACDIASGGGSKDKNKNGVPDECEPHGLTWHVDASAPPGGDGSAASPFRTLAEGIAPSLDDDTILVADGVYTGPLNRNLGFGGRNIVVRSQNGSASCVIDCDDQGSAFFVQNGETAASRIEGFTILDGLTGSWGGGIRLYKAHTAIRDVVFSSCRASEGGGLDLSDSNAVVNGCRFDFGVAEHGAGLSIHGGSPQVGECTFTGGQAAGGYGGEGGGVYVSSGTAILLTHLRLIDNDSSKWGGAITVDGGAVNVANSLFAGNTAPEGAAIRLRSGNLYLRGSTLAGNLAPGLGAIHATNANALPRNLWLDDCIVWDDPLANGGLVTTASPGFTIQIQRCDLRGGPASVVVAAGSSLVWGPGNLDLDPLFADPDGPDGNPLTFADNDYRLGALSPCTDAGDNALVIPDVYDLDGDGNTSEPTPIDLDGLPRFADDPAVPDTGAGTPPIVDLGAYERP